MGTEGPCQEVYIKYTLLHDHGVYSKYGKVCSRDDDAEEIIFETQSERYRIREEAYIDRYQSGGWYHLGTVTNLVIRDLDNTPNYYTRTRR